MESLFDPPNLPTQKTRNAVEDLLKAIPDPESRAYVSHDALNELLMRIRTQGLAAIGPTLRKRDLRTLAVYFSDTWPNPLRDDVLRLLLNRLPPPLSHLLAPAYFNRPDDNELRGYLLKSIGSSRSLRPDVSQWRSYREQLFKDGSDFSDLITAFVSRADDLAAPNEFFGLPLETAIFARIVNSFARTVPLGLFLDRPPAQWTPYISKQYLNSSRAILLQRMIRGYHGRPGQDGIYGVLFQLLGDPRIDRFRKNWADQSPEDLGLIYRWLIARDITAFFGTLKGNEDRLVFWRRQIPRISETRLLANGRAFMLRIKDFAFIEFGATGNALYVYRYHDISRLPLDHASVEAQLKNRDIAIEWFSHSKSWEYNVENYLRQIS